MKTAICCIMAKFFDALPLPKPLKRPKGSTNSDFGHFYSQLRLSCLRRKIFECCVCIEEDILLACGLNCSPFNVLDPKYVCLKYTLKPLANLEWGFGSFKSYHGNYRNLSFAAAPNLPNVAHHILTITHYGVRVCGWTTYRARWWLADHYPW